MGQIQIGVKQGIRIAQVCKNYISYIVLTKNLHIPYVSLFD